MKNAMAVEVVTMVAGSGSFVLTVVDRLRVTARRWNVPALTVPVEEIEYDWPELSAKPNISRPLVSTAREYGMPGSSPEGAPRPTSACGEARSSSLAPTSIVRSPTMSSDSSLPQSR